MRAGLQVAERLRVRREKSAVRTANLMSRAASLDGHRRRWNASVDSLNAAKVRNRPRRTGTRGTRSRRKEKEEENGEEEEASSTIVICPACFLRGPRVQEEPPRPSLVPPRSCVVSCWLPHSREKIIKNQSPHSRCIFSGHLPPATCLPPVCPQTAICRPPRSSAWHSVPRSCSASRSASRGSKALRTCTGPIGCALVAW